MEILNDTQLTIASLVGRVAFPDHSLTVIIKGTFDLVPDGKAEFAEEGLFPTGDEPFPDDDDGDGSSFYPSDFGYFKPRTDLMLVGKCYAPDGKPAVSVPVTFQVGPHKQTLGVIGDREWKGLLKSMSDPKPFTEMDLRYENSYGGEGYKNNPIGRGHKKIEREDGEKQWPLPNIEDPENFIKSPGDEPFPAGFGPLRREWQHRTSKLGNYKGDYLEKRWPWFAEDFEYNYFNAAHPSLQPEGYLNGDEELFFENLHPEIPKYRSRLPGIRPRCFLNYESPDDFKELDLNLDTLWVDAEKEQLILVWRGVTQVASEEYEEISHLYLVSENLDEPAGSEQNYRTIFTSLLTEEEEVLEPEPEEEFEPEEDEDAERIFAEQEANLRAQLSEQGIDLDEKIAEAAEPSEEELQLLEELGFEPEAEEVPLTREDIYERYLAGDSFRGENFTGMDLSGLDFIGADFSNGILAGVNFSNSNLTDVRMLGTLLENADLSNCNLSGADFTEADLTGADLRNSNLRSTVLNDVLAEQANLENAKFEGAECNGALFSEANLSGITAEKVNFTGADFSSATLNEANLIEANLIDASLEGTTGISINLSRANLYRLRASENANFAGGKFIQCEGDESIWEGANLKESDFRHAKLHEADFTNADLEKANFSYADLQESRFIGAELSNAKFVYVNLFRGSLEKTQLLRTDFRNSNLYEVEFLESALDNTLLNFANLKMTKLEGEYDG
ncbi:MAG: DUF2169 domain-containing protein [Candidatus Marinimicrobia bacterium]|nr:DUF2169 domain-containing protein [Candidatus Neomarinimicrobiota bacterium]